MLVLMAAPTSSSTSHWRSPKRAGRHRCRDGVAAHRCTEAGKKPPSGMLSWGHAHLRLLAKRVQQRGCFCCIFNGGSHQLRLENEPHNPERGDRAEQHLFTSLLRPLVQGLAVMAVFGAGQCQTYVQIRQINRTDHASSRSNMAELLSCSPAMAKGPARRGRACAERFEPETAGVALRPCST